ncbi:MAG: L,D-transpeptidase [Elusimicrobiota bacterium]
MKKRIKNWIIFVFILTFFGFLLVVFLDIQKFIITKREYELIKKRISDVSKETKQLEKERNKIYRQSSVLKSKQLLLIEANKNLIEKIFNLTNTNLIISEKINELVGKEFYILVDTQENVLYLKQQGQILHIVKCSVGKGGILTDKKTKRKWEFSTPKGIFIIKSKVENPIWFKPDWAFVEEKKEIPLPGAPERKVKGELGKYAMDLGFGYKIHGTLKEEFLGRAVSHGCVRLGADDLEYIYKIAKINKTTIYVY